MPAARTRGTTPPSAGAVFYEQASILSEAGHPQILRLGGSRHSEISASQPDQRPRSAPAAGCLRRSPRPWTEPGKGIPIGNLTSQYFANFHLSGLDHFIKEYLRIEGYVRYMDDLVLFADEKDTLRQALNHIEQYLERTLCLKLKQESTLMAPVSQGLF